MVLFDTRRGKKTILLVLRPYHKHYSNRRTTITTAKTIWYFCPIIRWDWLHIWSAKQRNPTLTKYTQSFLLKMDEIRFAHITSLLEKEEEILPLCTRLDYLLMNTETTWTCVKFRSILMRKICITNKRFSISFESCIYHT